MSDEMNVNETPVSDEESHLLRLAEVAYRAYGTVTGGENFLGQPMPAWVDLPERIQLAWAGASRAVEAHVLNGASQEQSDTWSNGTRTGADAFALLNVVTQASNVALHAAAASIRSELVCCDVYEQLSRRERASFSPEERLEYRSHSICYWGEASARLVEDRAAAVFTTGTGQRIRVHSAETCDGEPCVVHAPSDHKMREWPTHWRADRGIMERLCTHGVGHPDPDDRRVVNGSLGAVHGCDGCCR